MKKKISILILFTLILNLTLSILTNLSFASTKSQKKNSESYWSTKNAPLFYGTAKITLKKGILDEFHVLDTRFRFRIFARDFENEDLTSKITYSENVKIDEEEFRAKWIQSQNNYSVIESEPLTLVLSFTDMKYMTNYYKNGFTSLDQFLAYYQKVVEKMDEYVGLDFNPEKITDQNVKTKYLIRANFHGVGAAYYAGDHVGVNNSSMASFFEMNWGGLHELAHGYQGSLGKGAMQLGEVANNIIGYYIQIDKNIYFHQGNWLRNLSAIEEDRNRKRLADQTFLEVDEPTRLYVIVNLLDALEGGTTYGKMFS